MNAQQPIEDIGKAGWQEFITLWGAKRFPFVVGGMLLWSAFILWLWLNDQQVSELEARSYLFFMFVPIVFLLTSLAASMGAARRAFWQAFAHSRGASYEKSMNPVFYSYAQPFLLRDGNVRMMENFVAGEHAGVEFRTYEFLLVKRDPHTKKNEKFRQYTIFEFRFRGDFPHIFLDYRNDRDRRPEGTVLRLPPELERDFTLVAPEQYEIEALEIFTPELLAFIASQGWRVDIELFNGSLYIFRPERFHKLADLNQAFDAAVALAERLAPRLTGFRFAPVGTNPATFTA